MESSRERLGGVEAPPEAEAAARLGDVEYRAVFDAAPDGIVIVDREGRIRDVNRQICRLFGCDVEDLLGRSVEMLVPERLRLRHREHRAAYMKDPQPRPMGIGMELVGRRRDGSEFPVEISLSPLDSGSGLFVIATVRDVTERIRLRELGVTALRAAEDERGRLARELHDDTAQRLAALLLRLRLAARAEDVERGRILEELRNEIQEAAEGVRRIARGLRPPALEDAGVVPAIRAHARSLAEASGLVAEVDADAVDGLLTPDGKLVLYRVVQEALSNVVRHARTDRVRIRIMAEEGRVTAVIEDDGEGFDPERPESHGAGLGMLGMRERVATVGGRVAVSSQPGRGTRVRVEIPVAEAEESRA